ADRQGVSIPDRRGEGLAGRPLPRALAAPRLPLHVRARLHGGVSALLGDRGRVRRLRRPPGQPRRHAFGGVAGAAREGAGVQAADGVDVSLGVLVRQRLQPRLQCLVHRAATARGGHRIQLPARAGVAVTQRRGDGEPHAGDACRRQRGHDRNRPGHVHSREARHERVRARGRRRLPRLFRLCAGTRWPLGHVPVARPRAQGAQRDGNVVAPPRRVQKRLSEIAMGEMPMAGGGTMSMAWTRMPGQTWPGTAASFLVMWVVMMVAMMLPSLLPMLWRYRQAVGRTGGTRLGRLTALVGMGYFFVWSVFGMAVFPLGVALAAVEMQHPALARSVPIAIGMVILMAGSLQLTAWKARHLA